MNLQGKNIIVTGATGGLGSSLVIRLWELNANLFLISKTREKLLRTALRLKTTAIDKKYYIADCDFTDLNSVNNIGNEIIEFTQGNIYALINNAAVQNPSGRAWEVNWEDVENNLKINLFSPMMLMRIVIPFMIKNNYGKIINLSGGGATNTRPFFSSYAISKTSLVRYSEILADELRDFNIQVNCVAPGNMNTGMTIETLCTPGINEKEFNTAKETSSKDKEVTKYDAIQLIEFLLSEESNNVSGLLISAVWDDWSLLMDYNYKDNLDKYKLRRQL